MSQQTTTSNNAPTNDELLQNQLIARYEPGRFVSTINLFETGRYFIVIPVHDSRTKTGHVFKSQTCLDTFKRELEVFQRMRGVSHFPHLVDYFGFFNPPNVINYCIVMTIEGESIQKLTGGRLGYCHRDIHFGNVTIKRESDGCLTVKLIDFNGAVRLDPPSYPTGVMTTWRASWQVCEGMPYTFYDDLTSAVFILFKDENPNVWFEDDTIWIAELYAQIQKQRNCRVNYIALFQMLETAVPGIDPLSPMNYRLTENY